MCAQVMGAQAQMEARLRAAQAASDDWKRRAEWALRRGDEDLAREALQRRKTYEVSCLLACPVHFSAHASLVPIFSMLRQVSRKDATGRVVGEADPVCSPFSSYL